jgi:beta-galactosidase
MNLRSLNPDFMRSVGRFERALSKELAPFRLENGGNILMIQVENEYGSYAKDKPYVSAVRDSLRAAGWDKTMMFQCDWSSNFTDNALEDLLWTMNFGTGANIDEQFSKVGEMRPDAPKMCSEFWSGWFDGWGTAHQTRPADKMVGGIKDMLERGISFSLYMTHGGTSFGQWAGSNNTHFSPDCTSYDYDAPVNEQGAATPKYFQLRELLQQYSQTKLPAVPKAKPVVEVPEFEVNDFAPLFAAENRPEVIKSEYDAVYCSPYYYIKMNDARGFMHQLAGFGHHQVLIFGDYTKMLHQIGEVMGFKVLEHK